MSTAMNIYHSEKSQTKQSRTIPPSAHLLHTMDDHRTESVLQARLKEVIIKGTMPLQLEKTPIDVDKVKFGEPYCEELEEKPAILQNAKLSESAPGFIGEAILYSGEENAGNVTTKYLNETQDWSPEERKSRLGLCYGINNRFVFDPASNTTKKTDVNLKVTNSLGAVPDSYSVKGAGFMWGYKVALPLLGQKKIEEVTDYLQDGNETVEWKKGESTIPVNAAKNDLGVKLSAEGIPYGYMRDWVGRKDNEVKAQLEANNATPVFIHSFDADAPNFLTLTNKEESDERMKVLDAYSQQITGEGGGALDMIIGGYNLLSDTVATDYGPTEISKIDYRHTLRSNAIDIAIRQAIHSVYPMMTYPTEPNFVLRASKRDTLKSKMGTKSLFGKGTSEGRMLLDNLMRKKLVEDEALKYNPLASVPTGVQAGGQRLKIVKDKKYDVDSFLGRPQGSVAGIGDDVPLKEQYILQAQSLAGASRLTSAYGAMYNVKSLLHKEPKLPEWKHIKGDVTANFAHVEQMVYQLLACRDDHSAHKITAPKISKDVAEYPIEPLLNKIADRLTLMANNPSFYSLAEDV